MNSTIEDIDSIIQDAKFIDEGLVILEYSTNIDFEENINELHKEMVLLIDKLKVVRNEINGVFINSTNNIDNKYVKNNNKIRGLNHIIKTINNFDPNNTTQINELLDEKKKLEEDTMVTKKNSRKYVNLPI